MHQDDPLIKTFAGVGMYNLDAAERALGVVLGLDDLDRVFPHGERVEVGQVELDGAVVTICLEAWPSFFYTFTIENAGDGEPPRPTYKLTCGSGALDEWWPIVEKLCDGMLGIERKEGKA